MNDKDKKAALENVKTGVENVVNTFTIPLWVSNKDIAKPYLPVIEATEKQYQIPKNLLLRLIQQESAFRLDVITGKTISSAGATGIAQIVPKWHPNVNPLDPIASIKYAGYYLKSLFNQFGTWTEALAAYNWGPGNVKKWLAGQISKQPKETINYVAEITRDVKVA